MNTLTQPPALSSAARPPGPGSRWLGFDHLARLQRDTLGYVAELQARHGDHVYLRLGRLHCHYLLSPEAVRQALLDEADAFIRWEHFTQVLSQLFGQSVLVTEGATWQRQRRMLMPAFLPRRVAGYAHLMASATRDALAGVAASGRPEVVDVDALLTTLTMDAILRTLFSSRAPEDAAQAAKAGLLLNQLGFREALAVVKWPDWLPFAYQRRKRWALRILNGLVDREIAQRERLGGQAPRDDLLAMLMAARDEEDPCARLSRSELHDQCMLMFQAGHETTATALIWWSRLMAEHPEALQRARAEVDAVLAGQDPGPEALRQLPWLEATLKEAMRLYPPVGALMTRRALRDVRVGPWTVRRGDLVQVLPWVLQRDPRWFEAPLAFRPERFLPGAAPVPRGAWMPFGLGPRVCIGQHFAMLEMGLVAAMLLQRLDWAVLPGSPRPEPELNVTLRQRGGLKLLMTRRPGA